MVKWGFLTNHALVLIHVIDHPRSTLREIARAVGITERATLSILRALEEDDIIARHKEGRRNRYTVNLPALLSHRTQGPYTIAEVGANLVSFAERVERAGG